jgi:predicted membrane protein
LATALVALPRFKPSFVSSNRSLFTIICCCSFHIYVVNISVNIKHLDFEWERICFCFIGYLFLVGKQGKSVYQISTTIIFWREVFPIDCFALWLVILSTITI